MNKKVLNLEPFQTLLTDEIDAGQLADKFNKMLINHLRIIMRLTSYYKVSELMIREADDYVYYMIELIDALRETAELNADK